MNTAAMSGSSMSAGWSAFVVALVVLNVAGSLWLILWTAKRKAGDPGPTDTSHVWDENLTEYNKPLPKWWVNLFYLTIVFAIGYLAWYPGLGAFRGYGGWSSAQQHDRDKATEDRKLEATFAPYAGKPIDAIAQDPKALKLGKAIFANTCAACHGSSGQGAVGYPNLTDDIWHWGGAPDQILETVLNGRQAAMPAWEQALGGKEGVTAVAVYVQSLHGLKADPSLASIGRNQYETICVSCHGPEGKGMQAVGAPDLTDDYWLYGDGLATLQQTIGQGRNGLMPAHGPILGETRARVAAAYVWSLSHTSPAGAATAGGTR